MDGLEELGMTRARPGRVAVHAALILYTLIACGPILLILVNSFKERRAIFGDPLALPGPETFSLVGFQSVLSKGDVELWFFNSFAVTVVSIALVVLLGAM